MSSPQLSQTQAPAAASPSSPPNDPASRRAARRADGSHAANFSRGFFVKLVLLAMVDALGVYVVMAAWAEGSFGIMWSMGQIVDIAANMMKSPAK